MRVAPSLAIFTGSVLITAFAGAADELGPLLKPVVPPSTSVRVRITTSEEKESFLHFEAQVPKAKAKKGEMTDIKVALEVRPGKAYVTAKKWQSWGYEIPANKVGVLPELVIRGVQLAPKPTKGRDLDFRVSGLKVEIVEPPKNADTILGCDLLVSLRDLTRNSDRLYEPRMYFSDHFVELTVPAASVKRPGTGDDIPPEPGVNPDEKLVPFVGATTTRGVAVFTYAALNGLSRYRTPDEKEQTVSVTVSSTTRCPGGIAMSLGTARGCKVDLIEGTELKGAGTSFETAIVKGTVKEFRIGFQTGPGLKAQQDLVLKDVTVWVDKNDSGHMVWLGPEFLHSQFKDPVYACGPDGAWKLHGRVMPEKLQDVKTRPKKP
jgi:hypothetical protein